MKINGKNINDSGNGTISVPQITKSVSPVPPPTRNNYLYRMADFGQNALSLTASSYNPYMRDARQLVEIDLAVFHDSYVARSVEDHMNLMLSVSDYSFVINDETIRNYIESRMELTMKVMQTTQSMWITKMAEHLVKYHNLIIVKTRISSDRANLTGLKFKTNRITTGYHIVHPASIMPVYDATNSNKIVSWRSGTETISADRVIHISVAPENPENQFGLPYIMQAIMDVKMMRELEELDYTMIWRHINPLLLFKIGDNKVEWARGDDKDIAEARDQINSMPVSGWIAGTERWNIEAINVTIGIPDILEHLKYFRDRAITGLRLDPEWLGLSPGGSEGTMYNLEKKRLSQVRTYQKYLKTFFEDVLFAEWINDVNLPPIPKDKKPRQVWKEVDFDNKIKQETHYGLVFTTGGYTHGEYRLALGLPTIPELADKTIWEIKTEYQEQLDAANAALKSVDNKVMPANQHKKKASPTAGRK